MSCKKDVQVKLGERVVIEANYDFTWLRVKVDMDVTVNDQDNLTAKQLREMPIRATIKQLQDLLEAENPPSP